MSWGENNGDDRVRGEDCERRAAELLEARGYEVVPHPYGATGPDLWAHRPGEPGALVEVRSKYPDRLGRYGLESEPGYEKPLLWRAADIYYLICDTRRGGWFGARMRDLPEGQSGPSGSYHNGSWDPSIPNVYWLADHWSRVKFPERVDTT